ncbi:hypothetical protein DMUE_3365 [Dictyocoela muelleri]|nr:hypothetical protein DMUE_3365 [Dictyocoela muelleri]
MKIDTNEIQDDIADKIREYKINNPVVGTIESFKHTIHYTSPNIILLTPYKVPINIIIQTKEVFNRLLALKIIRKSNSPFNFPAIPIYKRNGSVRLEIDFPRINAKTTLE